jgi:hypothetical protein
MTPEITIPNEVRRAVKEKLYPILDTESEDVAYRVADVAIRAMLAAWPGMCVQDSITNSPMGGYWENIILPLTPQENSDAIPQPLGGWAAGHYWHKACRRCGKEFEGDKRAWHCEPCSKELANDR